MSDINKSIELTLRYTSFFSYPLTPQEVFFWAITSRVIDRVTFMKVLEAYKLKYKPEFLISNLDKHRTISKKKTQALLNRFRPTLMTITKIPTIKFVGLTGSLSMDNPGVNSDYDLMLVTSDNTLWLTRPLLIFVLLFTKHKPRFHSLKTEKGRTCSNLWMEESHLVIPKDRQNLYTAHECLQIKPLYDPNDLYRTFLAKNSWIKQYYANAFRQLTDNKSSKITKTKTNKILLNIEILAFLIQKKYMDQKITNESISLHQAFFHPNSLYQKIKTYLGLK